MNINHSKKRLTPALTPLRGFLAALKTPLKTEGSALVTAIILSVVIAMLAVIGAQLISTSFRSISNQEHQGSEADNIARAGLVDAISWFRNQTTQPVCVGHTVSSGTWADVAFNPQYSTSTALSNTIDSSIGLVREYALNDATGLYGRYEVSRQTPGGAGVVFDSYAVHDITGQRYFNGVQTGNGYSWYIGSKGYIYRAGPSTTTSCGGLTNFNPKNVLARSLVSTEIRRIIINNPNKCAVITNNEGTGGGSPTYTVNVYKMGRIQGGTYGIGYSQNSGGASPPYYQVSGGTVTGTTYPPFVTGISSCTPQYILGVSTADLQIMANYLVTNVNQLPKAVGNMSLVYVCGNATFDTSHPISSSGILFVDGDLKFSAGAHCSYQGLIYCTGKVTVEDGTFIQGCVVAWKGLNVSENSGATELSAIVYSDSALNSVRATVCRYREMKSTYRVFSGIPNF